MMLIVFAFSVTPKKILHDLVANHTDKSIGSATSPVTKISTNGFVCKCDNLVAESPFTEGTQEFVLPAIRVFDVRQAGVLYHFYATDRFFFSLRGPPAMA